MNMLKNIVLALVLTCAPTIALAQDAGEMLKMQDQMFTPNVKISITSDLNAFSMPQGFCSGQIIHSARDPKTGDVETYVLTAKHCTDKTGQRMEVIIEDHGKSLDLNKGIHYEASVWGQSYKSDLALLKLDDKEDYFEKVAKIAPKGTVLNFGDKVELVGYPFGLSQTWTEGRLGYVEKANQFFSPLSDSGRFFRATPMMAGGNSGSSMFFLSPKSGDYEVIGVLTGGAAGFAGFYTPLDELREYLDQASKAWGTDLDGKKNDS